MRRHYKPALIVLIVALAIVALTAASAMAGGTHPEFIPTSHEYPVDFAIQTTGISEFESDAGTGSCESILASGEITGPSEIGSAVEVLKGCSLGGIKCNNGKAGANEVVSETLEGVIGYIKTEELKSPKLVGLELGKKRKSKLTQHPVFATFQCGTSSVVMRGNIIGEISPFNKAGKLFELHYREHDRMQQFDNMAGGLQEEFGGEEVLTWDYERSGEYTPWVLASGMELKTSVEGEFYAPEAT